ncbi:MAG TPA: PE-PPE domain-containing protein [Jiangellaceae bacterium]
MFLKKLSAGLAAAASAAVMMIAVGAPSAAADPEGQNHYYIEVGGTGSALPHPDCTSTYQAVNERLRAQGDIPVPVCYAASFWPFIGSDNAQPAPFAPTYDESVQDGWRNGNGDPMPSGVAETLRVATETHRNDPSARITIVGYSQGADVADRVLEKIANNETEIPRELVNGKLYADPRQPETGLWRFLPVGTHVPVIRLTSPGLGPVDFPGMEVERHCIQTDGICDATTLEGIGGYFVQHPRYQEPGGIIDRTIDTGGNGVVWHERY